MSVLFPKLKIPKNCLECGERDAEYDGSCMLMPHADFESYESQYACCPIIDLARTYGAVTLPEGSRIFNMNGVLTYNMAGANFVDVKDLTENLIWKEEGN